MSITDRFQILTPWQKAWLPCLVLAGAVFAAYVNVYQNEFVWDDLSSIIQNKALLHWSNFLDYISGKTNDRFYRPVMVLLYFFVYHSFGLSKIAFHGLNVLLQAANACFVYRLGGRLGFYQRASFAAALLWGVHPMWSEAVAYVSGIASLLVAFFLMSGLLVLLPDFKPRRSGAEQTPGAFAQQIPGAFAPRKFWLASLFMLLALGSKESAVVFPALVMSTMFLASEKRLHPAIYLRTWPLWLLAAAYVSGHFILHPGAFISYDYQDSNHVEFYENNIINRILTSLATLPMYFSLFVWPRDLHMDWHFPIVVTPWAWQVLAGVVIVALSLWQIIRRGKHSLPLTWGLLWFAIAFSPNSGILMPLNTIFAENWIYLPTIGLSLGAAQRMLVWIKTFHSKKPLMAAAVVVALAATGLGTKTYLQNEFLHDPVSLFDNIIKYHPESPMARYALGKFYFDHKSYQKAAEQLHIMEYYDYSVDKDYAVGVHMILALIDLNVALEKNGTISIQDVAAALPTAKDIPGAIEELRLAQQIDPKAYPANASLAAIYYYLGDKKQGDYYSAIAEKNSPKDKIDLIKNADN